MEKKNNRQAYAFLSPFIVLVSVFYIAPAILTIVMSFTNLDGAFVWEFVGFANYVKIFNDPNNITIFWNTFFYILIAILLIVILDIFIAVMTTYFIKNEGWSSFFKSIVMIPMITPSVVYSIIWIWLLDASEYGYVNASLMNLGVLDSPINWIAKYPFAIIIIAQVVMALAYGAIIFSSAIKNIPENQFKAAHVDGASEWEIIKSIILPDIKPHIRFIVLWETLGLMTNYINILLITNGGPLNKTEVWALSAYHKAFVGQQYGYGSAISVMLILVVFMFMLLMMYASHIRNNAKKEATNE